MPRARTVSQESGLAQIAKILGEMSVMCRNADATSGLSSADMENLYKALVSDIHKIVLALEQTTTSFSALQSHARDFLNQVTQHQREFISRQQPVVEKLRALVRTVGEEKDKWRSKP